ncbi:MAG TPA: UvrD-helicase domain-containing protein [Anaeromyxobacteraceae bacterium]|nr:UvrD-helicase domain-containing protein [Anaeromyxobacteraceae bacterium]
MDPVLDPLNDAQRQAVLHGEGPLLVLAGAGSGKTRVIVHRIAHLVRDGGVLPWHVLAVTFTNKAAGEMRERLSALLGDPAREAWVQTFHAFGARFLRREAARAGLPPEFAIYDDADQMSLAKRLFAEAGWGEGDRLTPREALSRIDRWKNRGLWPGEVSLPDGDAEGQAALEIYRRYQRALERAGAADFGDLLVRPLKLLAGDEALRARWAGRFRHVLVDEFQDTNPVQYRLVRLLAGTPHNVCVVGDDDQAIYRWRGADVANILEFDRDFPGTRVVKLEQNYRSTQNVLDAAHAVISRARRRREKRLWTEQERGEPLRLLVGHDEHEEAERIAQAIQAERLRGTRGDEIAVLYRVNAQSRPVEAALRAARVPYAIVRGTSFYERAEVKDAAAYLRLALNPRSDLDLVRVVNRPPRGIGEKTVERLRAFAEAQGLPLYEALSRAGEVEDLGARAQKALAAFRQLLADLHARVPGLDAGVAVQEAIGKSELLGRLRAEGTDEAVEKVENLLELVAAAREFDEARIGEPPPRDPEEPRPPPLAGFLEQIALLGEADAPTPEGRVALMTLHAAKGLEFESVILAGLEEGMLPYQRPWRREAPADEREAELDEERRLCYVGMTRAKARLTLSLARRRMGYGEGGPSWREAEPSRFLGDLPPELFGLPATDRRPDAPVVRRPPGSLPGEPVIEYEDAPAPRPPMLAPRTPRGTRRGGEPTVDYAYDQRPEASRAPFAPGERVRHATLGEGLVRACDGTGADAKVTVAFFEAGERRVVARYLRPI